MERRNDSVNRLLRAAASAKSSEAAGIPFGFETRVIALWRAQQSRGNGLALARLLQRVALVAIAITIAAGGAAWWQVAQPDESGGAFASAYSIADTAIEDGALE